MEVMATTQNCEVRGGGILEGKPCEKVLVTMVLAVVSPTYGTVLVCLLNPGLEPTMVYKGTYVALLEKAE